MATFNKDMTIYEAIQLNPDIAPIFFEFGMHCLGCPISRGETIEQAAMAHGNEPQVLLDRLNEFADQCE